MSNKTKVKILSYLVFFQVFLMICGILRIAFKDIENPYKGMISAGLSAILAPRINEYNTQSGKQMQLKWLFLSKSISI